MYHISGDIMYDAINVFRMMTTPPIILIIMIVF